MARLSGNLSSENRVLSPPPIALTAKTVVMCHKCHNVPVWYNDTMAANKRIRISEENQEELHELKEVGQSYDDVIDELLDVYREYNRAELFERIERNEARAPEGFTNLDELDT